MTGEAVGALALAWALGAGCVELEAVRRFVWARRRAPARASPLPHAKTGVASSTVATAA